MLKKTKILYLKKKPGNMQIPKPEKNLEEGLL